jgi:hypothetical protein
MHLRRALLLFAIVLGLAAVAASISRPANVDDEAPPAATTPSVSPGSAPPSPLATPGHGRPVAIDFDAGDPRARPLERGRAASVTVAVESPGVVEIPGLGVSTAAEPLTPARFDVLPTQRGRYRIRFVPAAGDAARHAGTLVVREGRT